MAIYERLSSVIHGLAQLSLIAVREPHRLEPAQEFFAGHTDFAAHDSNALAVTLDFNHLTPMDDIIKDALALVSHVSCRS